MAIKEFIKKNLVMLVMIPALIGGHYGWSKMQNMDALVQPYERKPLPIVIIFNKLFSFDEETSKVKAEDSSKE